MGLFSQSRSRSPTDDGRVPATHAVTPANARTTRETPRSIRVRRQVACPAVSGSRPRVELSVTTRSPQRRPVTVDSGGENLTITATGCVLCSIRAVNLGCSPPGPASSTPEIRREPFCPKIQPALTAERRAGTLPSRFPLHHTETNPNAWIS